MKRCIVRSETIHDYHAISDVNAVTFTYSYGAGEAALISVLRSRKNFDPDLSLVAELDNKIIGHVLFTPQRVCVKGELLDAVILAPIAVYPEFQNQDIGSQLIEEGHKRAKEKGFQLSILIGHPEYYPRFGYSTHMWSTSSVRIQLNDIPLSSNSVTERRIQVTDLEELNGMWEQTFQGVDMAFKPELSITGWISPSRAIQTTAIEIEGILSGYIRYEKHNPGKILCILAKDSEALIEICAFIKSKLPNDRSGLLALPLSPESCELIRLELPYQTEVNTGPEKMLKILDNHNASITEYCKEVTSGNLLPGSLIWPVEFDIC